MKLKEDFKKHFILLFLSTLSVLYFYLCLKCKLNSANFSRKHSNVGDLNPYNSS